MRVMICCQTSIYPARAMTTRPTAGCVLGAMLSSAGSTVCQTAQLAPTPPSRTMMPHRSVSDAKNARTLPWQEGGVQTRVDSTNQAST